MGLRLFSSDRSYDPAPPNPNPYRWSIVDCTEYCGFYIVTARYQGCTTYGGRKLMLCKTKPDNKHLDPHLLNDDHIVVARFKPTHEGFALAKAAARELQSLTNNASP